MELNSSQWWEQGAAQGGRPSTVGQVAQELSLWVCPRTCPSPCPCRCRGSVASAAVTSDLAICAEPGAAKQPGILGHRLRQL